MTPTDEQIKDLLRLGEELGIPINDRLPKSLMDKFIQPQPDPPKNDKPVLVLDFDGVLHSYISGWQGAETIPDPPVSGAVEFCIEALQYFNIIIVSSRCNQVGGYQAINNWLAKWKFPALRVSKDGSKPAAFLTLDDRAVTFEGKWPNLQELMNFTPWYKRK